jgi:hypothetical protein
VLSSTLQKTFNNKKASTWIQEVEEEKEEATVYQMMWNKV